MARRREVERIAEAPGHLSVRERMAIIRARLAAGLDVNGWGESEERGD